MHATSTVTRRAGQVLALFAATLIAALALATGSAYASDVAVRVWVDDGTWEGKYLYSTEPEDGSFTPTSNISWDASTQTLTLNSVKATSVFISTHSASISKVRLVLAGTSTLSDICYEGTKSGPSSCLEVSGSGTVKFNEAEEEDTPVFIIDTLSESPDDPDDPESSEGVMDTTKDYLQIAGGTINSNHRALCSGNKVVMTGGTLYVPGLKYLPKNFSKTGGTTYFTDVIAIVYHYNGGTAVPGDEDDDDVVYVGDKIDPDNYFPPARYGYLFQGWCTDKNLKYALKKAAVKTSTTGAIHIYAKWKKISGKPYYIAEKYGSKVSNKAIKKVNKYLGKLPSKRLKEFIMMGGRVYVVGKNKRSEIFGSREVGIYISGDSKKHGIICLDYKLGVSKHAVTHEFGHWNETAHAKSKRSTTKKLFKKYRSKIRSTMGSYAAKNWREGYAECYSAIRCKELNKAEKKRLGKFYKFVKKTM